MKVDRRLGVSSQSITLEQLSQLATGLLGRVVGVGWPHACEAVVYELSSEAGVARLCYGKHVDGAVRVDELSVLPSPTFLMIY